MNNLIKTFITIAAFIMTAVANAADYTLEIGTNTLKEFDSANCTFTATADGKVLIETQEVFEVKHADKNIEFTYVPGSGFSYSYQVNDVKAGDVITATIGFVMNSNSKIKVTVFSGDGAIPVEVTSIVPNENITFDWNTTGMISISLNKNVTISGIKFIAGDYSDNVEDVRIGTGISFNIASALNNALNSGKIKPGETFKIAIEGLCEAADKTNLYNGDGVLTINFVAPHPQHNFIKASVGDTELSYKSANTYEFLSFYPKEGSDGLFVFEFDDNISTVGSVIMAMGNIDLSASGKYHRSNIPYTIEGSKLIVDARGTLRTLAVLFPAVIDEELGEGETNPELSTFDTSTLTITLSNVLDSNNNAFICENSGSVGSYSFVMKYKEIIDEAFIDGDSDEFAEGAIVTGGKEIKLWLSNSNIKFDAIAVSYFVPADGNTETESSDMEQKTVVVDKFNVESDGFGGEIISFTLPEMPDAVAGSTVRVALQNASSLDGMPHYLFIEYKAAGNSNSISKISTGTNNLETYSINGAKVNGKGNRGLYISGGKKVLVK